METHASQPVAVADTLRQIDRLVDELAVLSQSDLVPGEFYNQLLGHVVSGLAVPAAAIWSAPGHGDLRLDGQIALGAVGLEDETCRQEHRAVLGAIRRSDKPCVVPPGAAVEAEGSPNATGHVLVVAAWQADAEQQGVVEIFLAPGASFQAQQGYLDFVQVVAQLLADYHHNRQLRSVQDQVARFRRFERLVEQLHKSLDVRATAFALANEGRWFLGVDRVAVLLARGRKQRIAAVSGVDTFNRRADILRRLEHLATVVTATIDPLWHTGEPEQRAPIVEQALQAYLDQSHATLLAVVPLWSPEEQPSRPPRLLGALVVERFHGGLDEQSRADVASLQTHGGQALDNALQLQSIPLAGPLARVGRTVRRLRGWPGAAAAAGAALVLLAAIVLAIVPADFQVEARGKLQPVQTREIFAPDDGVIDEIRVAHGEQVTKGQVLVAVRKPELDFELKRVWGELQTSQKKLGAAEAERLRTPSDTEEQRRRQNDLAAQEEELRGMVRNLGEQMAILRRQQDALEIRSPIAGYVLTWNTDQLLRARPVGRGQILLTVADLDGPWELELHVPDRRITPVMNACRALGPERPVSFILATDPATRLSGTLERLAQRTEAVEPEGSYVPAIVRIDRRQIPQLVPGATLTARIDCGRRSLAYVWFHDLLDAARTWIWF